VRASRSPLLDHAKVHAIAVREATEEHADHELLRVMIEWLGPWSDEVKSELERFAEALATHERGYPIDGRLVIVSGSDGRELKEWMKPDAYADYQEKAQQQPLTASGKTFVARDGVVTAVVSRFADPNDQLVLCSHELIEMGDLRRSEDEGWVYPEDGRELLGIIFADEYATERLREEIAHRLGWPFADTHDEMALVHLADQIQGAMPTPRYDPPPDDFWAYWQTLARMWSMTCARRLTSPKAEEALASWSRHPMIDDGWAPVERGLAELYDLSNLDRDELVELAAERIWDPIEQYGREAWTQGLGPGPG
jgi:hypothetical protein